MAKSAKENQRRPTPKEIIATNLKTAAKLVLTLLMLP